MICQGLASRARRRCSSWRALATQISTCWATIVRPDDVVLDVGANIAYVRCHLTHLVGRDGRVFAVGSDPVPADLALMAHIQQKGREAGHGRVR